MASLIGQKRVCKRCLHPWIKREDRETKRCPRCKSPYWDRDRQIPKRDLLTILAKIKYLEGEVVNE